MADEDRQVTKEEGRLLAEKFKLAFFEVSALDGSNVTEIFMSLCRSILANHPKLAGDESGKGLTQTKPKVSNNGCQC